MTDPSESNHWDLLASELGADPPPPEEKKQHPEAEPREGHPESQAKTPSPGAGTRRAATPSRPRALTDWSTLADELGIESRDEPPPASPNDEDSLPAVEQGEGLGRPADIPSQPEPVAQKTEYLPFELPEPNVESEVPPVETGEDPERSTRTDLVPTDTPPDPPSMREEGEDSAGKRDGKTSGRRRRKRRPKVERPLDEEPSSSGESGDSAPADADPSDEESPERPKRRRRRRSSGKKKGAAKRDDDSAESVTGSDEDKPENLGSDADESAPSETDDDKERGRKRGKEKSDKTAARAGHRSIPTWEEAIGVVISVNMESRAKRPGGGSSSRSRGGRGRGGRNRSGEKKNG